MVQAWNVLVDLLLRRFMEIISVLVAVGDVNNENRFVVFHSFHELRLLPIISNIHCGLDKQSTVLLIYSRGGLPLHGALSKLT